MLPEAMLTDLRARAARVRWCECTGCTTKKVQRSFLSGTFLMVQPVHSHQHSRRAARARKYAMMVSANMAPVALKDTARASCLALRPRRRGVCLHERDCV